MTILAAVWSIPLRSGARALRRIASLPADRSGGVAVVAAVVVPAIMMLAVGGIELSFLMRDRSFTQSVADAAALMGVREMSVARTGAENRTQSYAEAQLKGLKERATVTVTVTVPDENSLKVSIKTHRMSFFGNLLPPGGFTTRAEAVATSMRQAPLCVITTGGTSNDTLKLAGSSKLTADCLVHGDDKLEVDGSAVLTGKVVESVGTATGPINPAALVGAAKVGDPFSSLNLNPPSTCLISIGDVDVTNNMTISPGVHCLKYSVKNGSTLTLAAGVHYFFGDVILKNNSKLAGTNVTLVFLKDVKLDTKDGADVSLTGSASGALAGFVMATARNYTADFHLDSDPFSKITGAIYVPSARLKVEGSANAAASSDWTVIAAKSMELIGSPNLIVNANYAGSPVPVPKGVGPNAGSRLQN